MTAMTVGSFHGFGNKNEFTSVITDVIWSRFLGYPPCFRFSYVKGSFRGDSRKCGALVPKKQFLYYSKKQFLYLSRVPSRVPSHVPCPLSRVLCTVPICVAGWLRNKKKLGSLVLCPLHCPCGGLCFLQRTNPRILVQRYTWVGCTRLF